jgi:hypothetical protein
MRFFEQRRALEGEAVAAPLLARLQGDDAF